MLKRMWRKGTLIHCQWKCKLIQPLWRTVWRFLKKKKNRSWFFMWGEGRGGAGVCPEGWLRWPAHHLMVLGVGHTHSTLVLFLAPQKLAVDFSSFFILLFIICPKYTLHTVTLSPLWFLCILLLKETFVQVQALQQSPRSQVSGRSLSPCYSKNSKPLVHSYMTWNTDEFLYFQEN